MEVEWIPYPVRAPISKVAKTDAEIEAHIYDNVFCKRSVALLLFISMLTSND